MCVRVCIRVHTIAIVVLQYRTSFPTHTRTHTLSRAVLSCHDVLNRTPDILEMHLFVNVLE